MRKILFGLFSFFFSLSYASATTWNNLQLFKWPTCNIPQNEWRFGLGIGVEYLNLDANVKEKFPFGDIYFGDKDQIQKHVQFSPSLEIGKTIFNDYYIGVIASWHYSDSKKKSRSPLRNAAYFRNTFKMSYYTSILAKPGYKMTPKTMIYALIGPSLAKWSHTTDQLEYNFRRNQEIKKDSFKVSGTSVGMSIGGGLEQIICTGLALSINYTHTIYKSRRGKKNMSYLDNARFEPKTYEGIATKTIKPSSDSIVVRLAYFF